METRETIAAALLLDCPLESLADHTALAALMLTATSTGEILSRPECKRWPKTYVWLREQLLPLDPHTAAVVLGRRGGAAKSAVKAAAVRANGAKGGRPAHPLASLIADTATRITIVSGEGERGTAEEYAGKRTVTAIKTRLAKERAHGDRWARVEIETTTHHSMDYTDQL